MTGLSLVVPMAGRGSRFSRQGIVEPKPLIELLGRPFFWWAIESVTRAIIVRELVVVVLEEHIRSFRIDERVRSFYPDARIVILPQVTKGAAETAAIGVAALESDGPFAVNDCDHAFCLGRAEALAEHLSSGTAGALVGFRSRNPAYSYIELAPVKGQGELIVSGTVEKRVASPYAIAGCYFFSSKKIFEKCYSEYSEHCPYDELFLSGIYNLMIKQGLKVVYQELQQHISFGTPEEYAAVQPHQLTYLWGKE